MRPASDPVAALTAASERFSERAEALVGDAGEGERAKIRAILAAHAAELDVLRAKVG